jgi:hypothetical protein
MPRYRGRFQYLAPDGAAAQQGACEVQFDRETFTLAPEGGTPLVFDLGDADTVVAADYEVRLALPTGRTVLLQQFGKPFQDLARELLEAWRERTVQCLLLEDMQEVGRIEGAFTRQAADASAVSGAAELRLYKTNLAVLPTASQAFQWRLADVDTLRFDAQDYAIVLERDGEPLRLGRLGKRTEWFHGLLRDAHRDLRAEGSKALHGILPFLDADRLQALSRLLPEGRSTAIARLATVDARIPAALAANAVDEDLKPYHDELLRRSAPGLAFVGYKRVRAEDGDAPAARPEPDPASDEVEAGETDTGLADADASATPVLYWFFFAIASQGEPAPGHVLAWEASSRSGRATYFFRVAESATQAAQASAAVERAVGRVTRVLGMVNFRRRPIYLPDSELDGKIELHRYAIAARRIADLRQVRAEFVGRAIHSSFEAWKAQVDEILAKAARNT